MAQVALALQFCHGKQTLHRDIKPSNVYLDKTGLLKLGDFGMARSLGESLAQTVVGTPYAMAPELCHSQPYSYKVHAPARFRLYTTVFMVLICASENLKCKCSHPI